MTVRDQLITDLVTAVSKPPRKPAQAGQVRRSSATLLTWDAAELRGSVDWNGTVITDVPLLGAIDAFGWAAGDEVVLDTIPGTNGGFSSPMILGRVFRPGAANAAKVLQALQNEFARQISHEIFAEAIRSAETPDEIVITDTSGGFIDAPDGLGPEIPDVDISTTGRALVFVSAAIFTAPTGENGEITCYMGYEISGATSVAAGTATSVHLGFTRGTGTVTLHPQAEMSATKVSLVDGLNSGVHTFTAQYRVDEGNASDEGAFLFRNLTVIPF